MLSNTSRDSVIMQNRLKGSQLKLSLNCFLINIWSKVASICYEAQGKGRVDLKKVIEGKKLLKGHTEPHKMNVMNLFPQLQYYLRKNITDIRSKMMFVRFCFWLL